MLLIETMCISFLSDIRDLDRSIMILQQPFHAKNQNVASAHKRTYKPYTSTCRPSPLVKPSI
jgi:hypothetical protein